MATMVGLPVIGLYAATNRRAPALTTAATGASTSMTRQRKAPRQAGRTNSLTENRA